MYKARMTRLGAHMVQRPDLEGKVIEYGKINQYVVSDLYFEGTRLGGVLCHAPELPGDIGREGVILITKPE
jgi:hypothetical protein